MNTPNLFSIIGYSAKVSEPNGPVVHGYFIDTWGKEAQARFERWYKSVIRKAEDKASLEHNRAENFLTRNTALLRRNEELERQYADLKEEFDELKFRMDGLDK